MVRGFGQVIEIVAECEFLSDQSVVFNVVIRDIGRPGAVISLAAISQKDAEECRDALRTAIEAHTNAVTLPVEG